MYSHAHALSHCICTYDKRRVLVLTARVSMCVVMTNDMHSTQSQSLHCTHVKRSVFVLTASQYMCIHDKRNALVLTARVNTCVLKSVLVVTARVSRRVLMTKEVNLYSQPESLHFYS